jgi:hypothetical protein
MTTKEKEDTMARNGLNLHMIFITNSRKLCDNPDIRIFYNTISYTLIENQMYNKSFMIDLTRRKDQ